VTAQWSVARECANLFLGPLTVTVTADGTPVDDAELAFALLPYGQRPTDADWTAPAPNPDGQGVGILAQPVTQIGRYGWWVKVTAGDTVDVLEPESVAWVVRS